MKLSRLFQPRNPLFWIMLAVNALSTALAWITQHRPLNAGAMLVVGIFAIGNALIGTWLMVRLLRTSRDENTRIPKPSNPSH